MNALNYMDNYLKLTKKDLYECYHQAYKNFLKYISKQKNINNVLVISNMPNEIDILAIIDHLIENKYNVYNLNSFNKTINKIEDLYQDFVFYNFNYCSINKVLEFSDKFDLVIIPCLYYDNTNKLCYNRLQNIFSKYINSAKVLAISFDFAKTELIKSYDNLIYDILITDKGIYE